MVNEKLDCLAYSIAALFRDKLGEIAITNKSDDSSGTILYSVLLNPVAHIGAGNLLPSIDYSPILNDPEYIKYSEDETGTVDSPSYHAYLFVKITVNKSLNVAEISVGLSNGTFEYFYSFNIDKQPIDDELIETVVDGYYNSFKDDTDKDRGGGLYILMGS